MSAIEQETIALVAELLGRGEDPEALGRFAGIYAAGGIEVFQVNPANKRPVLSQYQATTELAVVAGWWERRPDALIGRRLPDRRFSLDIDPRYGGLETWEALEEVFGPIRVGRMHYSGRGDGGFHAEFLWPEGLGRLSAKRLHAWAQEHEVGAPVIDKETGEMRGWTSGIDLLHRHWRYTILPPSPHPATGKPYHWREVNGAVSSLLVPVAKLLVPLTGVADDEDDEVEDSPDDETSPTAVSLARLEHSDSIADWFTAARTWREILGPHGWTPTQGGDDGNADGSRWRHPGASNDHSASIRHGQLFVYTPNTAFEETEGGDPVGYTRFRAWAVLEHGGDLSAAARAARALKNPPAPSVVSRISEPAVIARSAVVDGATFVLDEPVETAARWGRDGDVLWQQGESLLLCGSTGVGKTTLAIQLVGGLIGVLPEVLGYPVLPAKKVLYLAMDRPRQIQRAMRRLFGDAHRDALAEHLIVRRGPMPADIGRRPEILVEIAQEHGAEVMLGDSLKDAAVKLTDDEVGGNINRAVQFCNVAGVDVGFLHHQRKGSDGRKPTTLEDVYGSTWIPAGAGSVVLLWGEAGSELVELSHLKQPSEIVGPLMVEHDHHAGTSKVAQGWDALAYLTMKGDAGATIAEAAQAQHGTPQKTGRAKWKQTERRLRALVRDGRATSTAQTSVGSEVRYHALFREADPRGHPRGHGPF